VDDDRLGGPSDTRDLLPPEGQGMGRLYRLGDLGPKAVADRRGEISLVALLPFGEATPPPMPGAPPAPPGTTIPVDPVPTSVVRAPDGSLYVGQLTGFPFVPGAASVFRIPPGGGAPEVVASGFTLITDIALGEDGSIYVVEFSTQSLLAGRRLARSSG
jgi:hypothetical protein